MSNVEAKKENVSYESLLAGALVRFDKVDESDLKVLIDEFYAMYGEDISVGRVFNPYIESNKGIYSIAGDTALDKFDAKVKLGSVQGNRVKSFMGGINPEVLVLRKVELLGGIPKHDVSGYNLDEIVALSKAMNEGYLTIVWNDDCLPNDYEEILLTSKGKVRLFMLDYCSEVEEFSKLLDDNGYDSGLIYSFLLAQDFSFGVYEILNLDNFFDYCNTYDKNRYSSKKKDSDKKDKGSGYKKVPKDKK